jgi:hypothetical protein
MKNSCEGVTDESAILAFIDSLERGQLLRHRLLRERNEGVTTWKKKSPKLDLLVLLFFASS